MTNAGNTPPGTPEPAGLPPEFNDVEHFQSVVRTYLNREIFEDFKDLGDETWQPTIGTSRASMRVALTHKDDDSLLLTNARMMLYYFTYGGAKSLQVPVFMDMTDRIYDNFTMRPEVNLFFYKKVKIGAGKYELNKGHISYKLVNETSATLTPTENRRRAEKIKDLFAEPNSFIWHKGRIRYTYLDTPHGYDFRFLANSEAEAKRVITQVMRIENHTPDWDLFKTHVPERTATATPQRKLIYGKEREVPRWRPTVEVPFIRATMKIHGMPTPVTLVDVIGSTPTIPSMAA